ncbi:BAG family molecular chaperone regulator 1-like [Juglans microcarpa x Juglans regia]|uniref:BAG family molecular chaperone regulator 1-like n=1 Tax=Juglans microcarpa x Juglans regia TaxID=2249226 RepID=UPI001B7F0093|nr:BAG family molecular chaperone regulator 1-like [Juglans microcarpa x Juglans regia]XP_041008571.1 BAG family molecular chaperone regulator 1-like [Juglans microcarpa x Juglans regia]
MMTKTTGVGRMNGVGGAADSGGAAEWEMRPGGMLVQKRDPDSDRNSVPAPTIRVKVKFGSTYHEIYISSQATFGELKKMLSGPTGLHHEDQKLIYKDRERNSKAFLDSAGVKDRSKIVLVEDPISQERRYLEMRRNAKMEKASKFISEISLEVDRLAGQVSAMESIINRGGKVAETDVLTLIELLMNQLLKLDGIMADGDAKLQRKMQVRRVQKYVETLDMLKIKNSKPTSNGGQNPMQHHQRQSNGQIRAPTHGQQPRQSDGQRLAPIHEQQQLQHEKQSKHSTTGVVVTTKWETFDSNPALVPLPSTPTPTSATHNSVQPKFNWEFFE